MKQKTTTSDKQIANKGNEKDCVMSILQAIAYALGSEVHEQQVRERVDHLSRIVSDNVVLQIVSNILSLHPIYLGTSTHTSSHQSRVDVTGENQPSCSGG